MTDHRASVNQDVTVSPRMQKGADYREIPRDLQQLRISSAP